MAVATVKLTVESERSDDDEDLLFRAVLLARRLASK